MLGRKRSLILAILALGILSACATILASPLAVPYMADRLSGALPKRLCPDLEPLLIHQDSLPPGWSVAKHPRPDVFLEHPFAALNDSYEVAVGLLYLSDSDGIEGWAVHRVYCLPNDLRAIVFYTQPGLAGYVDALAVPASTSFSQVDIGWHPETTRSDQYLSRCRTSTENNSPFAPFRADIAGEVACGIWGRYGRYVTAFEVHFPDGRLSIEDVQRAVDELDVLVGAAD